MRRKLRRVCAGIIGLCMVLGLVISTYPMHVEAGASTLTVTAGYFGLPFVTKGEYSVSDLQSMGVNSALYTMNTNGGFLSYADAEGVYISDLLYSAGIRVSNVNYVNFKAVDGHYASKNYYVGTLFDAKYAFPELSLYYGKSEGVTDEGAVWASAAPVYAMLAIRDNYGRVDDFSEYTPGEMSGDQRFRLMIGQDYPGQIVAADSIYEVNTVMVTYEGSPQIHAQSQVEIKVGEDMNLEVSVDSVDSDISQMISQGLKYSSSNSSVVQVDGNGKLTPVSKGEAEITIYYEASDIDASDIATTVKVIVGEDENSEGGGDGTGTGNGDGTGDGNGEGENGGSGTGDGTGEGENGDSGTGDGNSEGENGGSGTGSDNGENDSEAGNDGDGTGQGSGDNAADGSGEEAGSNGENGNNGSETGQGSSGNEINGSEEGNNQESPIQSDESNNQNQQTQSDESNNQNQQTQQEKTFLNKENTSETDQQKVQSEELISEAKTTQTEAGVKQKVLQVRRVKPAGSNLDNASDTSAAGQSNSSNGTEGGSAALGLTLEKDPMLIFAAVMAVLLLMSGGMSMYVKYRKEI